MQLEQKQELQAENPGLDRYELLVSHAPVCIHEIDLDGRLIFMNPAGLALMDASLKEIRGCHYLDFVGERDRKQVRKLMNLAFQGESSEFEFTFGLEGQVRTFASSFIPITDEQGHVAKLMGITQDLTDRISDITHRQQAESELRKLARAVEFSSAAVFITDVDHIIEYVNPKFTEITGYSSEEAIGKSPRILHSGETPAKVYAELRETIASGGEWNGELYNRKKDGSYYWAHNSISGVEDDNGVITHYISVQDDVTIQKQADDRYRDMIDNIDGIVWESDGDCNQCGYISQKAEHLLKYPLVDFMSPGFWIEKLHPDDRTWVLEYRDRCHKEDRNTFQCEYRMITGDDRTIWLRERVSVTIDSHNNRILRGITVDITHQKEAEAAKRSAEEQYRAMFMEAPLGIALDDAATGEIIEANPAYARIVGRDQDEIKRIGWQAMTHPDDLEKELQKFQLMSKGKIRDYQITKRYIKPDGSIVWVDLSLVPIYADGYSSHNHNFIMIKDVTDRQLAEESLRESQKRYSDLADLIPQPIWETDLEGNFTYSNRAGFELYGYTQEELENGVNVIELFAPENRQAVLESFAKSMKGEHYDMYEYVGMKKDGTQFPIMAYVSRIYRKEKLVGLRGITIDITERKQAEAELVEGNTYIQGIVDNVFNGLVTIDEEGIIESFNPAAEAMLGYEAQEVIGRNVNILMPEPDKGRHQGYLHNYLETGEGKIIGIGPREVMARSKNGELIPIELSISEMRIGDHRQFIAVLIDITERKKVEAELGKLHRAVEYSSSGVIITDTDYKIEYINPKFTEISGYTSEDAIGKFPRDLHSGKTPDSVYAEIRTTTASGKEWKGELYNRKNDGSFYWASYSVSNVKDSNGVTTHYIAMVSDISREYKLKEQLSYQATYDSLTGLINRREFERRAERLISNFEEDKGNHALCFMDLDQFKVINDTCGHIAGDELLRQLGDELKNVVRNRDTLARLGGDEFGILMEHCSLEQARRVAEALASAVNDFNFVWDGQVFHIGVSIGLVGINQFTPNLTELLKQADAACYMAKDLGRNRIHVYHPEDSELAQRHSEMSWVARINLALEEDRYCLCAQAIMSLESNTEEHYELLIRMIDENGKLILPGAFLPAAERYDLIGKLDSWVIENALALLVENPAFVDQIHFVSINLSGNSVTSEEFLDSIILQLKNSGIEPGKICFEITETAAISNLAAASSFISRLKDIGCHFALDDFGSGLSSFAYLKNLPVDYLKIDGMFVKDIVDDSVDRAMVKSINDIGQVMGMQTIAEFVENDQIKDVLIEIGVNFAQGYGIGEPVPFEDLIEQSKFNLGNIEAAFKKST